jgi:HSP20 family protein
MTLYAYALPHRMARRWMAAAQHDREVGYLPVDVLDEAEAFVLTARVPGLKPDDLKVQVLEDVVHLEGEFPTSESQYLMRELPAGTFVRELRLPSPLDANGVEAKITDGILTLRLPKAESARPKTIKVAVN